jgi:precorrin-6B methylase 2
MTPHHNGTKRRGREPMETQSGEQLLAWMRGYQLPCVLAAGVDLEVFETLADAPGTATETAARLHADPRGMTILLDALAGHGILSKDGERYAIIPALRPYLTDTSPQTVLPMLRHQANCLRRWARLPWVVHSGTPADPGPSLRGAAADHEAFIQAMHVVSTTIADDLIREVNPGEFRCVLDVGGATGTWTMAWLRAAPAARALLFDLPTVIPLARQRLTQAGYLDRVDLVAGDFYTDPLPRGADLVWVSAIIHQNSRAQNRDLYRRIAAALEPGGRVLIRDIIMDERRTAPAAGVLFAVNMLVATAGGNTYTLPEIRADLESAGFGDVHLCRRDDGMHAVVAGRAGARA